MDLDDHGRVPPEIGSGDPEFGVGHVRVEPTNLVQFVFFMFDHSGSLQEYLGPSKAYKMSTA